METLDDDGAGAPMAQERPSTAPPSASYIPWHISFVVAVLWVLRSSWGNSSTHFLDGVAGWG